MKRIAAWFLVALAIVGAAVAIQRRAATPASSPPPAAGVPPGALPADGVVVTYFTTDVRCPSCHKIESLARSAVESHFGEEVRAGRVLFRTVNTDRPENRHFVEDYGLVSKTVVVSVRCSGTEARWVNLQDVWEKLSDPAAFDGYVAGAVSGALTARSP